MLLLPDALRAELESWIRAGYPHETCGLLIGRSAPAEPDADPPGPPGGADPRERAAVRGGPDATRAEVLRVVQARNLNAERAHDRYELDPADFMAADLAARDDGLSVVGIWHSHPDHPAEPSETDRSAAWEGWSYLIASVTADGVTAVRSWRLLDERFHEETLTP